MRTITIISGGQTGADRAALDFAIAHGIRHDGWCPRGRLAEDGPLDDRYELRETPSRRYSERTEWNVRDSDATVVFSIRAKTSGGTALTMMFAKRFGKPCLHLGWGEDHDRSNSELAAEELRRFLSEHEVARLNIAGPRASQEPQIATFVCEVLATTLVAVPAEKTR